MASLYADSVGTIIRAILSDQDAQTVGAPVSPAFTLAFDETTNAALAADYRAGPLAYTMPNGTLTKNGQAVTITAPSQDYQTLQLIRQAITALKGTETLPSNATILAAIQAVQGGTATNAQAQLALAVVMRLLGLLAQRLLNNGTLG